MIVASLYPGPVLLSAGRARGRGLMDPVAVPSRLKRQVPTARLTCHGRELKSDRRPDQGLRREKEVAVQVILMGPSLDCAVEAVASMTEMMD